MDHRKVMPMRIVVEGNISWVGLQPIKRILNTEMILMSEKSSGTVMSLEYVHKTNVYSCTGKHVGHRMPLQVNCAGFCGGACYTCSET